MIPPAHLLCPIDFSACSTRAFHHAVALAHAYDARLTVLHVYTPALRINLEPMVPAYAEWAAEQLSQVTASLPVEVRLTPLLLERMDIREAILEEAALREADLLVMGSRGMSGLEHLLLGSVTESVVRRATCPVMVVPDHAPDVAQDAPVRFAHVLCALDFSDSSRAALEYAVSLSRTAGGELVALHVIEVPPEWQGYDVVQNLQIDRVKAKAEDRWQHYLQTLEPDAVTQVHHFEPAVEEGRAHHVILREAAARQVDAIVMGTHGHRRVGRLFLGSNTAEVIRSARCPVLIVRRP